MHLQVLLRMLLLLQLRQGPQRRWQYLLKRRVCSAASDGGPASTAPQAAAVAGGRSWSNSALRLCCPASAPRESGQPLA